jgi:kynurenine formamidase
VTNPAPERQHGRPAWMTPGSQAKALANADTSRVFDLAVDYFVGMPTWTEVGDPEFQIWLTHTPQGEGQQYAGTAFSMYSHTGTHFWSGSTAERDLGSRAWRVGGRYPPIIARAVLLDVAGAQDVDCLPDSYAITADDLTRSGSEQLQSGDVALVRTGRMSRWPDRDAFMRTPPGLGMQAARHLADERRVMCVGVDCGGEALPPEQPGSFLPVHSYLLTDAGVPIIENMWLEELASSKTTDVALLALPMKLRGSTGLPLRPIAMARV